MAWNEPGKGQDPWGGGNKPPNKNKSDGPPDLDQIWRNFRARFSNKGGNGGSGNNSPTGGGGFNAGFLVVLVPVAVAVWLLTGFYKVNAGEKGVVLRLGAYTETVSPGLHWHLPYPISQVSEVDTQQVRGASNRAVMLTKDENIVDVEVSVQYRISNAMNYLFRLQDPENTVEQVLRSAVREIVGTSDMNQVIQEGVQVSQLDDDALKNVDLKQNSGQPKNKDGLKDIDQELVGQIKQKQNEYPQITDRSRAKLPDNVRSIMQFTLDHYDSGIKIVAVNVQYAQPPEPVQGAFQEAIKAREEEERAKNIARAYARDIVARAQGQKAQMIAEAKGYQQRKIDRAQGQATRFSDLLTQYQRAPDVTRERLYLETMSDVLSASHLIVNDGDANSMMYLPLQELMKGSSKNNPAEDAANNGMDASSNSDHTTGSSDMPASSSSSSNDATTNADRLRSRSRNS